jgi:hypothetical protein
MALSWLQRWLKRKSRPVSRTDRKQFGRNRFLPDLEALGLGKGVVGLGKGVGSLFRSRGLHVMYRRGRVPTTSFEMTPDPFSPLLK